MTIALPLYDYPTRSASGFLIRYVLPRSVPPQLIGPLDRERAFQTLSIGDIIIGVGHGNEDNFAGHNNEIIMTTELIPDVKDKIVILISCQTAQKLGPALINKGASSYIGFKDDLVWVIDADRSTRPWSDEYAKPSMMPIIDCVNSILSGKTAGESFSKMLNEFDKNIESEDDELIKSCLQFNRRNAALLGDTNKRIVGRPKIIFPIGPPPLPPLFNK